MIKPTLPMCKSIFPLLAPMLLLGLFGLTCLTTRPCRAQEQVRPGHDQRHHWS